MRTKRIFEILPGGCAWLTLLGLIFLSWKLPIAVVIFIVLFDLYWLLKIFYLFFHLRYSFVKLRANLRLNWFEKLRNEFPEDWQKIYHLLILPMYREPYELVKASLQSLLENNYSPQKLIVVLATEKRGGKQDQETASKIQKEFGNKFFKFLVTVHPSNLRNEIPGKGSNETWAAKEAKKKIIDVFKLPYENILVSSFDIDTRPGRDYFAVLTYNFLKSPHPQHSSYQPIPLFVNNLHNTSLFARIIGFTSSFWQFMQQARPHRMVTFSSHSLPFKALAEVGFWPTDIVSEDSQIFFVLFNHYQGNWRAIPLYYPVYMDAVVGSDFWEEIKNLYKQQRRWAWGVENWIYIANHFPKNKGIKFSQKLFWLFNTFSGFYSWATISFIIFLFGWLPNVLGGAEFQSTVASYNLPRITGFIMNFSVLGIITSAFLSMLLLPPKLPWFKKRHYLIYVFQWILMPFTLIFFSSLPALDALTRAMLGGKFRLGYWRTPKRV